MMRTALPFSFLLSIPLVGCGEKEPEEETTTEDYTEYCNEDPEGNLVTNDQDCDGTITAEDCDDADENSTIIADDGDCDGTLTAEDCDDNDANSLTTSEDADCDGVITNDDCDDNDASSTIVAEDGDCDGIRTENDCDDADENSTMIAEDGDCDGVLSAEDCDDSDPSSTIVAEDADCDTFLTAADCDDEDPYAFPGSAENELFQVEGVCYSDADGDGFGDSETFSGTVNMSCYLLEMTDSVGDGWSGNELEIVEDGLSMGVYANDASSTAGEGQWEQHCLLPGTSSVTFVFQAGMFSSDISFSLYYDNGIGGELIGSGEGTTNAEIIFDGITIEDGGLFYSESTPLPTTDVYGTDCDDSDAMRNPGIDDDGDGYTTCEDCDDSDSMINPDAEDEWYDGVDSDCSGGSDYDQDGDGYDSLAYAGSCSDTAFDNQWDCESEGACSSTQYTNILDCEESGETWSVVNSWTATGTDCDDEDDTLHPLMNEADPTACYEDNDGDGWGNPNPFSLGNGPALTAGTDCYDFADYIYPGAAYNEPDLDGDGIIDCSEDADGDGWGYNIGVSYFGTLAGTDCDDENELIAPDVDGDGDGIFACDDCDDEDASLQGGIGYYDDDGDGYGDQYDEGSLTCDFTTDSDANGAPDYTLDNSDCNDSDAEVNPNVDGDGDGADICHDCDDDDASVIGQEAYPDYDGDGFGDMSAFSEWVCALDSNGDGTDDYSLNNDDCYDSTWNTAAAQVYPGAAYNEPDIDGDGVIDCSEDNDGDGWGDNDPWYADVYGTDCDDSDSERNNDDADGDGYTTCWDTNDLVDCDDDDAATYPGAAYNEPGFDAADYATYECLTDGDGDGYGFGEVLACYTFDLEDTYGDGWNDGMNIEVFADGLSVGTASVSSSSPDGGYSEETTICVTDGAVVELVFHEGSYAEELAGEIFGTDSSTLGSLSGSGGYSGTQELYFNGGTYQDGDILYSETAVEHVFGGSDADDADAAVH